MSDPENRRGRLLVAAPGSVEEGGSDLDSRAGRGHGEHAPLDDRGATFIRRGPLPERQPP